MSIIKKAFKGLYPEKEFNYESKLKYSGKFSSYNGNIKLIRNKIQVNMSRRWRNIDNEIKMGLIQELLNKLFKTKIKTKNIDLYNIFIKKIGMYAPKLKTEPGLERSFDRVNEQYFYGLIDKPNFVWHNARNKLGSYDFGTDTISMSRVLSDKTHLDYVMYHEILHKKLKFDHKKQRTIHHTGEFRKKEKEFENAKEIEEQLKEMVGNSSQNKNFIKKPHFLDVVKKVIRWR